MGQEYEKLHHAANRVFEEARIQQLELQKLQGQLQQSKQENMAEQVQQFRRQKAEQWQKERHTVESALDALKNTIDQSDDDQMEVDDTLSKLVKLRMIVDEAKKNGDDMIDKKTREAMSQAEGDRNAATAQFSLTQQAVTRAACNAYKCLSKANSNVMLRDDRLFVDMNHNMQVNLGDDEGVGHSVKIPRMSCVPGEVSIHGDSLRPLVGQIPVVSPNTADCICCCFFLRTDFGFQHGTQNGPRIGLKTV